MTTAPDLLTTWRHSLQDPFRDALLRNESGLPERVRQCAEPVSGEPAFDPERIARLAADVILPAGIGFPHPLLEKAVRIGLAHIDVTFQGDHPKYGVGTYAQEIHDSFPPTIIATVDALTLWGMAPRSAALFDYWLNHFVRADGTIAYYGPSLSEYGQLLTSARRLMERGGDKAWLRDHAGNLDRLAVHLQAQIRQHGEINLTSGVPEADERKATATYFHNNAWIVRGLQDWAELVQDQLGDAKKAAQLRADADALRTRLLEAITAAWPKDPDDWWLRPTVEEQERPEGGVTGHRIGSYTNYRYWPELLSSNVLPHEMMERIVRARLTGGGQFCGTTRFAGHLDDWPLADHLEGLWLLGRHADYRLSVWGHICYHQAEGHLTAYEQVSFPPGRKVADYCLPCQLVAVRAGQRLVGKV